MHVPNKIICCADNLHGAADGAPSRYTPASVMGPMRSSPPSYRHAAELMLLSVVSAKAATLCCQRER